MGSYRDFLILTKPRVVLMVVITAATGFHLGSGASLDWLRLGITLAGVALAAAGTATMNQYIERDVDAMMERTRHRPLPDSRVRPGAALGFGAGLIAAGLLCLLPVGLLPFAVTAATVGLYLFVYTPMKRRSPACLLVGGVPGALPVLAGWVAARGEFGTGAWVLFGILFLWQVPHTLAIARLYQEDYLRAGIRLPPAANASMAEAQSVTGAVLLLAVSLLPLPLGFAGPFYAAGALALGVAYLAAGAAQAVSPTRVAARRTLLVSLVYLPALLGLLSLDKV